ncbi:MAG: site-2 protease family protein [Anaerovoracaceae bacterium]
MNRFLNPMTVGLLALMAFFTFTSGAIANPMEFLLNKALILPGIVVGLSFHEFAHGYVAYKLGDPTPKIQGRVTVNPAAHIDIVGFVALMFVGFGWGKAVEINPFNFKKRRRDELLVSIAGVTMNLIIAILLTLLYKVLFLSLGWTMMGGDMPGYVMKIIFYGIYMNILLMVFNLLPIPPLDGFGIVTEIFDLKNTAWYYKVYDKGFLILMVLIVFNFTSRILYPVVMTILGLLGNITPFI